MRAPFMGFLALLWAVLGSGCKSSTFPMLNNRELRTMADPMSAGDDVHRSGLTNANDDNATLAPAGFDVFTVGAGSGEGPIALPRVSNRTEPRPTNRKMIYSAAFTVLVSSVDEAVQKLLARTEELGGYLSRRNNAALTVRIPAAKFQTLVHEIPEYGRVLSESMNAQDVTDQHTDLTIRLENAEKSRKRLLELLEKAMKMDDILKIEDALRRLTGEIERIKGQLKLLGNKVAYSTLTVTLKSHAPEARPNQRRSRSRFHWINMIGIEQDMRRF